MQERSTSILRPSALQRFGSPIAGPHSGHDGRPPGDTLPVLMVVEGTNDIEFLRRTSALLHADDDRVPDVHAMERRGELVFIPIGGGDLTNWTYRLAGLGKSEFHLYDGEVPPLRQSRHDSARLVNRRAGCRAVVTSKRSLENYLHSEAIYECRLIRVEFSDDDDVAEIVARECFLRQGPDRTWTELPTRARRRLRNRVKRWLNTEAVQRMTPQRLAERDANGEVSSWLTTIAEMTR